MSVLVGGIANQFGRIGSGTSPSNGLMVPEVRPMTIVPQRSTIAPTTPFVGMLGRFRRHLTGTTIDVVSAALAGVLIRVFAFTTDALVAAALTDANGFFDVPIYAEGTTYYVYAEKAGTPEVFGSTSNQLLPV